MLDYFKEKVFTIEDKKDPTWEKMCQDLGLQLVEKLGRSIHYVLSTLSNGIVDAEGLLTSNGIKLPDAPKTRNSLLKVFEAKLNNASKILEEKAKNNPGVKW